MKGQFTTKYSIFREIWKIPCVVQNFPVLYLNFLSGKLDDQIPSFPYAVATLFLFISKCGSRWDNNVIKSSKSNNPGLDRNEKSIQYFLVIKTQQLHLAGNCILRLTCFFCSKFCLISLYNGLSIFSLSNCVFHFARLNCIFILVLSNTCNTSKCFDTSSKQTFTIHSTNKF